MPIETINPREDKEKTCGVDSPVFEEELLAEEDKIGLEKDVTSLLEKNDNSRKTIWKEKLKDKNLDSFVNAVFTLPTMFEAASTLKNIKNVLEPNRLTKEDRDSLGDEKIMALRALSESFETFSNYLINKKESEDELRIFWEIYEQYSLNKEAYPVFEGIRSGILGQVGIYHLIKSLGLSCSLASWEEDIFEGTDFIISDSGRAPNVGRLQVKYKKDLPGVGIINVKTYDPTFAVDTKVIIDGQERLAHFTPDVSFNNLKKSCSPDELAVYVQLPNNSIDGSPAINRITGIPSETLVKDFKKESEIVLKNMFVLS